MPQLIPAGELVTVPFPAPAFTTVSVKVGATQTPPEHAPLVQSEPPRHCLPRAHVGQVPPPQSTSVSLPFWMRSMQFGRGVVVGVGVAGGWRGVGVAGSGVADHTCRCAELKWFLLGLDVARPELVLDLERHLGVRGHFRL